MPGAPDPPTPLPAFAAALGRPDGLAEMLDGISEPVYLVDRQRTIRFWNTACERLTGYSREEVVGHRCYEGILRHIDEAGRLLCRGMCPLAHTMCDGNRRRGRLWLHHKSGHRLPVNVSASAIRDDEDRIVGAMESFTDSSTLSAVRERMAELEELAMVDSLTAVPNRRFLEHTLTARLGEMRRHGAPPFVVALGDLDDFKRINDLHGHEVGDRVLRMVATTLAADLRGGDTVARLGGEEFVLLLGHADVGAALAATDRLRRLVQASALRVPAGEVGVTISFGVTRARRRDSPQMALRRADALLYQSKRAGRNRATADFAAGA